MDFPLFEFVWHLIASLSVFGVPARRDSFFKRDGQRFGRVPARLVSAMILGGSGETE
jgi:hypothetical protein